MRHILFLALAAFTLAACTQDELAEQGTALPEGAYPITIASVQVAEALPQTRITETSDGMGSTWNERNPDMVIVKVTGGGNDAESTYTLFGNQIIASTANLWWHTTETSSVNAWYSNLKGSNTSSDMFAVTLANQTTDNGLAYVAKHALAFCWGVKPGWNILNLLYRYDNHPVALSSSLRRYAAYRTARKFLVYGQMLRPPVIRTAVPAVPVKWCISYRQNYFSTLMSPVPGNTWRAPDGSFALVLYNITEQEQPVSVTLDRKTYQLGNGTFRALYPAGQSFTAIPDANGCRIQLKVPPQSPVILELTGK